jgi:hypothetical protein
MVASAFKMIRWLLVLPAAIAVAVLVDGAVVEVLEGLGAVDRSAPWLVGMMLGHFVMGAGSLAAGSWMAPARRDTVATILFVLAIFVTIEAVASGGLPVWLILLLYAAFVAGAWAALRKTRQS